MDTKRKILLSVCIAVIIIMAVLCVIYRDTFFKTTVKITYPDGCVETYDGDVLISPECTEGRLLEKQKGGQWNIPNLQMPDPN